MQYIVVYDITEDKKRNSIARFLEGWGRRVQKSVFEYDLSPEELEEVRRRVEEMLVLPDDRCHIYRLCEECAPKRRVLGSDVEAERPAAIVV